MEHARRRRVWDHAFRPAGRFYYFDHVNVLLYLIWPPALKEYEPSMRRCVHQLVEKVQSSASSGKAVDMTKLFGCLMFDVRDLQRSRCEAIEFVFDHI